MNGKNRSLAAPTCDLTTEAKLDSRERLHRLGTSFCWNATIWKVITSSTVMIAYSPRLVREKWN